MQYVFILGHNPKLSVAEILALLPNAKIIKETDSFLILENDEINCDDFLNRLGGTIKIGRVISDKIDDKLIIETLKQVQGDSKIKFGLSYYDCKLNNLGLEIKKELKTLGINSRLVTSKDKALSSVIVTKNKVNEFLILGNEYLAETCAVQDFKGYGKRDFGRPVRDMLSGSMPPKLAKIMINLTQAPKGTTLLDPFCGSGTLLQEALLLGYKVIGTDLSVKAIKDSKENLAWFEKEFKLNKYKILLSDVIDLSKNIKSVDAIVTEPYLGPPLKGNETEKKIKDIISELSTLYIEAFGEFKKVLSRDGKIAIVIPAFRVGKEILELPIIEQIKNMGFIQVNRDKLIYSREGQKVWRQIYIFKQQF